MNVIKHRVYRMEFDVWEATQNNAEAQIDKLLLAAKDMTHCGNIKITLVSEEREWKI
jgi:hypothetical protein